MSETPTSPRPLLTVKQIAHLLNSSTRTVRRMIATGDLPVVRIGRLVRGRPEDIDALMRGDASGQNHRISALREKGPA